MFIQNNLFTLFIYVATNVLHKQQCLKSTELCNVQANSNIDVVQSVVHSDTSETSDSSADRVVNNKDLLQSSNVCIHGVDRSQNSTCM